MSEGHSVWASLEALPFSTEVRESAWLFPTVETLHVLALVIVIGSIFTVDLRLLGLTSRHRPFTEVAHEMLPWTWSAFGVASLAGLTMFSSKAVTYAANWPFRFKMIFLVLAGLNMLAFQFFSSHKLIGWDRQTPPPTARFAGGASLLLWTAVVATGRWIGFTT
jgi:hypothetical protein